MSLCRHASLGQIWGRDKCGQIQCGLGTVAPEEDAKLAVLAAQRGIFDGGAKGVYDVRLERFPVNS